MGGEGGYTQDPRQERFQAASRVPDTLSMAKIGRRMRSGAAKGEGREGMVDPNTADDVVRGSHGAQCASGMFAGLNSCDDVVRAVGKSFGGNARPAGGGGDRRSRVLLRRRLWGSREVGQSGVKEERSVETRMNGEGAGESGSGGGCERVVDEVRLAGDDGGVGESGRKGADGGKWRETAKRVVLGRRGAAGTLEDERRSR